jgi:hypothetical protein
MIKKAQTVDEFIQVNPVRVLTSSFLKTNFKIIFPSTPSQGVGLSPAVKLMSHKKRNQEIKFRFTGWGN